MRPLILVSTINSRHWNTCYLQLLSVQRCQHPPQAEAQRCCWGGSRPPQQQSAAAGGGVPTPPAAEGIGPSSPGSRLFAAAAPSHLDSCFSGTLEAAVFTAPSSPIHLRRVECWRFTKDL